MLLACVADALQSRTPPGPCARGSLVWTLVRVLGFGLWALGGCGSMTKSHIRRCACPCNGVEENDFHQSQTATTRPARRLLQELIASESPPLGLLHSIWRIRSCGIVNFVMIDRAFVARLWKRIRSALQEFKISRMQKRSDKRFRVVEVSKCERRRFSSSAGSRAPLSARCNQFKRSVRRSARLAASVVGCPKGTTGELVSLLRRAGEEANDDGTEADNNVTDERAPINNWRLWKDRSGGIGQFSPRSEIAAFHSSKSMEEFGSLMWEEGFLTTSASSKPALTPGESSSGTSWRWENRYRISDKSPQLLEPVRGKLTTLSSLMRTMSDRYARRTGKLTPVIGKYSNNNTSSSNKRPVLTQSQSAAPIPMQQPQQPEKQNGSNSISRKADDVRAKRYDNPFQDFLRQSFAERHSRSVHDNDRQP